jgi:hypothetical protein
MFDSNHLLAHGLGRIPGLKRLPVLRLLAVAEIAMLAKRHVEHLTPVERRRLIQLVRTSRGRKGNLSEAERRELARLVHKMEPRLFAGAAADKLSPIPLPRRFTQGPKSQRQKTAAAS